MRVIGIDPGTGILGFGVIDFRPHHQPKVIDVGVVATPPHTKLKVRLLDIYDSLTEIIEETKPDVMSIEKLFFARNITTAISVAEARGVVILVAAQHDLPVFEYTPLQIKQTLTGYGRADKKQMQQMVKMQLGLKEIVKPDDAADALAAAITHNLMTRGGLGQEKDLQL
ncbi:MAG: crossover junction endodeoxyribonuclease RuvC [Candidatus Saccharibacteria bacterium]|nr:crossover junction endodeoxyribonuclease RuvC [Candidatus Saccharibacteria bacterium]